MSTTENTETVPLRVVYDASLMLSVPVIADREQMDRLYEAAQTASGHGLTAVAEHLDITAPTSRHRWALGWSAPTDADESAQLVWYDPDKLAAIDAMVRQVRQEHPGVSEVRVLQGAGWNDWGVSFTGEHGDAAAGSTDELPAEPDDGDERRPAATSTSGTTTAAAAESAPEAPITELEQAARRESGGTS